MIEQLVLIEQLIEILHRGGYSLVVDNGEINTFGGRGVSDLYRILTSDSQMLNGATIVDKVVGKGATALMVLGKIRQVHADVISRPALSMLEAYGIRVTYTELVDNIINRKGNGICPVETLCLECVTAEECLPRIESFLSNIKTND